MGNLPGDRGHGKRGVGNGFGRSNLGNGFRLCCGCKGDGPDAVYPLVWHCLPPVKYSYTFLCFPGIKVLFPWKFLYSFSHEFQLISNHVCSIIAKIVGIYGYTDKKAWCLGVLILSEVCGAYKKAYISRITYQNVLLHTCYFISISIYRKGAKSIFRGSGDRSIWRLVHFWSILFPSFCFSF